MTYTEYLYVKGVAHCDEPDNYHRTLRGSVSLLAAVLNRKALINPLFWPKSPVTG